MATVVLQSCNAAAAPPWLETCLASVRSLAESHSWIYKFTGDELFERVPSHLRAKFDGRMAMLADLARLQWMGETLAEGADRVIWIDADVLVFAPGVFDPGKTGFAAGRQIWIQPDGNTLKTYKQIHNAVLTAAAPPTELEFLSLAAHRLAERAGSNLGPQTFGPKLLTALHNIVGFDVIESAGMASPLILRDLAGGGGPALDKLLAESASPLAAFNLCASYRGQSIDGVTCSDDLYEKALCTLAGHSGGLEA